VGRGFAECDLFRTQWKGYCDTMMIGKLKKLQTLPEVIMLA
jgi:hypothetical protein